MGRFSWLLLLGFVPLIFLMAHRVALRRSSATPMFRFKERSSSNGVGSHFSVSVRESGLLNRNRELVVQVLSTDEQHLPLFQVDGFLTPAESAELRSMMGDDGTKPVAQLHHGQALTEVISQLRDKTFLQVAFPEADFNRDGWLGEEELTLFLLKHAGMPNYDHADFLAAFGGDRKGNAPVSYGEFIGFDWAGYVQRVASLQPERFARYVATRRFNYSRPLLLDILDRAAQVLGLPIRTVRAMAEPLEIVHYPDAGHASCHFDSDRDNEEIALSQRFVSMWIYLNEPAGGGETVFYGHNVSKLHPDARSWPSAQWRQFEGYCQPSSTCPPEPDHFYFGPAKVVRPKLGRALFWYNCEVDMWGEVQHLRYPSIHAGCPVQGEKWGANLWIHAAGPYVLINGADDHLYADGSKAP